MILPSKRVWSGIGRVLKAVFGVDERFGGAQGPVAGGLLVFEGRMVVPWRASTWAGKLDYDGYTLAAQRARNFLLFKTIGCQEERPNSCAAPLLEKRGRTNKRPPPSRCTFHPVNTVPEQAQMTTKNAI